MKTNSLLPKDFSHYMVNSRSCRIDAVCKLECKFGAITLDFKELGQIKQCDIYARRNGGTGLIYAVSGNHVFEGTILSKTSQYFSIEMEGSILEIKRPKLSNGIIEILQIDIHSEPQNKELESVASKWKDTLSKCKDYKSVRISNGRLFAAEGAIIAADIIRSIETNPPNMTIIKDCTIKFLGSCEVLNLDVEGVRDAANVNYLPHMNSPAPIISPPITQAKAQRSQTTLQPLRQPTPKNTPMSSPMIYDSLAYNFTGINATGNVTITAKSVRIGHVGSISIPISDLKPGCTYAAAVEAQKVNGNGKICVSIQPNTNAPILLFTSPQLKQHYFSVISDSQPPNQSFNLTISRPPSATGDVVISRIAIVNDIVPNVKTILDAFAPPMQKYDNEFSYMFGFDKLIPVPVSSNVQIQPNQDRKFAIVIPSYNNSKWVERNITSALSQNYPNFRVIFVDDCSSDDTHSKALEVAKKFNANATVVKNDARIGALANLYNAIHSCADDEIVLTVDGDDWLADENVLSQLNEIYKSGDIWLTYGQYKNHPDGGMGVSSQIPQQVVAANDFRRYRWCASHLRTFYAWLFKKINRADLLMEDGKFYPMTWDFAIMFPMLEMAGPHSTFISKPLYVYNLENPINDHKVNRQLQAKLDGVIRHKAKYSAVSINAKSELNQTQVGLIFIATNKYRQFLQNAISSADRFFLRDDAFDVTYYVFSDEPNNLTSNRRIIQQHISHKPFPYASMDRFRHFTNYKHVLDSNEYLYYVDVDTLFVDHVGSEILGSLVGVRHCGFYSGGGSFETNTKSALYLPRNKYTHYYGGGFSGGKADEYLKLSAWCADKIEEDLRKGIMPIWHDETALNTYFANNPPAKSLSPSYHYPQGNRRVFSSKWGAEFKPKIILLDKPHAELRR